MGRNAHARGSGPPPHSDEPMKSHAQARVPLPVLVAVLAVGAFTTALNLTMLSPLLTAIAAEFHVSEAEAGQLATLTATCSGLTGLAIAPLLDRYPRGYVLAAEGSLLGTGTLLTALAPTFSLLFVGRAIAGVGGAIIFGVALATIGDLFADPAVRNRMIGVVGTTGTMGAVLGLPLMTQLRAFFGWRWAVAALLPTAAILLAGSFFMPHTAVSMPGHWWRVWRSGYVRVWHSRASVEQLAVAIAWAIVFLGFTVYLGAYAEKELGIGPGLLSAIFFVGGIAQMGATNLVPPVLARYPAGKVRLVAALLASANLLGIGVLYRTDWSLIILVGFGGLSMTFVWFCTSVLMLDSLPEARGALMGLQSGLFEFGAALGAAAVGLLLHLTGDYVLAFRALGFVLPLTFALIALSNRRPAPAIATP